MSETQNTLVKIKGITKRFGAITALENVNFEVKAGEITGLAGHNGAGKSVLIKVMGGMYKPDEGEIFYYGEQVKLHSPKDAQERGFYIVPQELVIARQMSVADNIFVGQKEAESRFFKTTRKKYIVQEAERLLKQYFDVDLDGNTIVDTLDTVTQRILQVVRCLRAGAKVIVFDETTAGLTQNEREKLFIHMRTLAQKGLGIIFISHMISEILEICDSVTAMREGKIINSERTENLDARKIVEMIAGKDHTSMDYVKPSSKGEIALSVKNLSTENNRIADISFDLQKGEIFGIYGLRDQGQTLLLETMFGIYRSTKGEAVLNGRKTRYRRIKDNLHAGLGYLPERGVKTVFTTKSILENMDVAYLNMHEKMFQVKRAEKSKKFIDIANRLKIRGLSDMNAKLTSLSGGNMQKALLARMMAVDPDVLMVIEPLLGIDIGAKDEIRAILLDIANQGKTIVISTAEIDDVVGICNRVAIIKEGRLVGIMDADEANKALIIEESTK
jgi:ABC-type sugar transport system ATPase subunit